MQPEAMTQDRVDSILTWIENVAKNTEGFIVEQSPLVVQELLAWALWSNMIGIVAVVAGMAALAYVAVRVGPRLHKTAADGDMNAEMAEALGAGAVVGRIIGTCVRIGFRSRTVIKVVIAPRLYILEWVGAHLL